MVNTSKDAKVEHPKIICIMNVARKCMNSRMFYFSSVNYKAGMNVVCGCNLLHFFIYLLGECFGVLKFCMNNIIVIIDSLK